MTSEGKPVQRDNQSATATIACLALIREAADALVARVVAGEAEPADIGRLAALYARLGGNPADLASADEELEDATGGDAEEAEMEASPDGFADAKSLRLLAAIAREVSAKRAAEVEELIGHIVVLGGHPEDEDGTSPCPR